MVIGEDLNRRVDEGTLGNVSIFLPRKYFSFVCLHAFRDEPPMKVLFLSPSCSIQFFFFVGGHFIKIGGRR